MMNLYELHSKPEHLLGYNKYKNVNTIPMLYTIDNYIGNPANNEETEEDIIYSIGYQKLANDKVIEDAVLSLGKEGASLMYYYAMNILGKRWKEAEQYIIQNKYWQMMYEYDLY